MVKIVTTDAEVKTWLVAYNAGAPFRLIATVVNRSPALVRTRLLGLEGYVPRGRGPRRAPTPEIVEAVTAYLRAGGNLAEACRVLDIKRGVLRRRLGIDT